MNCNKSGVIAVQSLGGKGPTRHSDLTIDLELLAKQCREAALGDVSWQTLLSNICSWLEADRAMMLHADQGKPYTATVTYNFDSSEWQTYNSQYNGNDPRMPKSKLTKVGETRTGQQYIANETIKHTDYFNVISRNFNILDSVHTVISEDALFGRQAISFHRGFEGEFFQPLQIEKMRALQPYLTDAFHYSIRTSGRQDLDPRNMMCRVLIDSKHHTIVLDGDVKKTLSDVEEVCWDGKFLRPKTIALGEFLRVATVRAKSGYRVNCRLKNLESDSSVEQAHIRMTVSPCPSVIDWLPNVDDMVMLEISRTFEPSRRSDVQVFTEIYGLTAAEARVLTAFCAANDLRRASLDASVSYETARWHLKNIFQKTGFSTQSSLLRAVSELDISNVT